MGRRPGRESTNADAFPSVRPPAPGRRRPKRASPLAAVALAGAAVGAAALYTRYQGQEAEWRHPPMGGFVGIDGVQLHYIERGPREGSREGRIPDLVLLHGNGSMAEDFALSGVLDLAAEGYRAVAFDRPGFGHSMRPRDRTWTPAAQAEILRAAFRKLGLRRPILAAHSWGTLVALSLALDHPDEVAGLVLIAGYYYPTTHVKLAPFEAPAVPLLGDLLRYTVTPALGRASAPELIRKIFAPSPVPRRFVEGFPLDLALRPWQIRASAEDTALMNPAVAEMSHRYARLRMPAVILVGTGDQIVDPQGHAARLHAEIGRSELRLLPGCGHMPHYDAPGQVVQAVDRVASGLVAA